MGAVFLGSPAVAIPSLTALSDVEDVDLVIFHQGSALTLDYVERWLSLPPEKTFRNIASVGNTVSASIPIALRDAELAGRLVPGIRVLLVGFGVGLSWGACLVTW